MTVVVSGGNEIDFLVLVSRSAAILPRRASGTCDTTIRSRFSFSGRKIGP